MALLLDQYKAAKELSVGEGAIREPYPEVQVRHIAYREAFVALHKALSDFIEEHDLIPVCDFILNQMQHHKHDSSYLNKCQQAQGTYNGRRRGGWVVDENFVFFMGNTEQLIIPIAEIEDLSLDIWYG
ncbi:hypothetical protein Hgul01_05284 [Herpetosiphon gulosus]|uniref:Uncharacterized protein n=2 Tax=Herpetosiphon gulosus TaxID=1973496 RepID=A0ABP9X7W2_9CHLR